MCHAWNGIPSLGKVIYKFEYEMFICYFGHNNWLILLNLSTLQSSTHMAECCDLTVLNSTAKLQFTGEEMWWLVCEIKTEQLYKVLRT